MNELALFAGAGGGILGGKLLGWRTVCAVEWEPYPACVLAQRQNDGILPTFPIWDDVRTFDGRVWRGIVDVVSGGFPCQDISCAGKGEGITGARSGLWKEMARIVGEVRPRHVLVENSPMLTGRGLGVVLGDLAEMGYDAEWGVLGAVDAGAPHKRDRIWILATDALRGGHGESVQPIDECWCLPAANTRSNGEIQPLANSNGGRREIERERGILDEERAAFGNDVDGCRSQVADTTSDGTVRRDGELEPVKGEMREHIRSPQDGRGEWWETEPDVGRVVNWVAARVDRLKAIGNGQVPAVVNLAWEILTEQRRNRDG